MADQQDQQPIGNIRAEYNSANTGMNMDNTVNQVPKGALTYALNAAVENFDANSINYQNEPSNEFCVKVPEGYQIIGVHSIYEQNKHVFFLANPDTGDSEIGYMVNNDCIYHTYINAPCLNFNIRYPIHKAVHKITNCATEIYWTDGLNPRRYLNIDDVTSVYKIMPGTDVCDNSTIPEIDCNKLKIQPNFNIPSLEVTGISTGGDLKAGTYQFAIQYCDSTGSAFTSYYSITNPVPIADLKVVTLNFDYSVGKSIELNIKNIDITGYFKYFNIAVIKTVNAITSVELIGTYFIDKSEKNITYTGQIKTDIRLSIDDIFEKFPYYDVAQDLTAVQDILVWDNLTSIERINYQKIANKIELQWQTYRLPAGENYADELNAANYRGYLRDEVYAFEIVFLLRNGKQTDGFHIPGRTLNGYDLSFADVPNTNADFIGDPEYIDQGSGIGYSPYWKIYNTGRKISDAPDKSSDPNYKGEWEYGDFAYWESTELYPCNEEVWGDLANQPIRHHKFPDVIVSPIFESATPTITSTGYNVEMHTNEAIFPIGVKLDVNQVLQLIQQSDLTTEQKNDIAAFKIVRADRATQRSIVAKGILRNVGKYSRQGTEYYYPNYPYNDLREDPFLLSRNNSYVANSASSGDVVCRSFTIEADANSDITVRYLDCSTLDYSTITVKAGKTFNICSLDYPSPEVTLGKGAISCNTYKAYKIVNNSISPSIIKFSYLDPIYLTEQFVNLGIGSVLVNSLSYPVCRENCDVPYTITEVSSYGYDICGAIPLNGFADINNKYRLIFNSPETSFGNPFLGNVLKLENVMYGAGKSHFVQVKKNAYYKLISKEAQQDALESAFRIAAGDIVAVFTAYQAYLTIYINGITRRNYAYSYNSRANYDYHDIVPNGLEIKQRPVDISQYLIPQVQSVSDKLNINNWNRESSIFIKTTEKDITKQIDYHKYQICNTVISGLLQTRSFQITDPFTLQTSVITIPRGQCQVISSTVYPIEITATGSGFTITQLNGYSTFTTYKTPSLPYPNETPSISPFGTSLINDDTRFVLSGEIVTTTTDKLVTYNEYYLTNHGGSTCIFANFTITNPFTNATETVSIISTSSATVISSTYPITSTSCNTSISDLGQKTIIVKSKQSETFPGRGDCNYPEKEIDTKVLAYYASLKNIFVNQYGQIYSYSTIDTGFQQNIDEFNSQTGSSIRTIFGGDTFINRFTFKIKLPFFIDNRVGAPDDSDIFYDEIGNVAYPKYWHSARSILSSDRGLTNIISIKAHNFDCPNRQDVSTSTPGRTYYDGKFYLFAYGIPNFYCESSYNVDLRQAFNSREGEYWPHVSTGIPDDWLQESFTTIAQDNTYYYNITYSKQNKENFFSHLPVDWDNNMCHTYFPFRAIYSDVQQTYSDQATNNWLVYRPVSTFDFPQSYGKLVSLDGIQNRAILARFENKTLLYNKLLTIDTSNPKAAYIGNSQLFAASPPIDFAETDLGYVGSQNKMLLKIPQGQVSIDAKRGQVFILTEQGAIDLSQSGSGMNRFFTDHLAFEIKRYFPEVDIDNHFTAIGLHGVYDSKYDRVIISKLDYIPQPGKIVKYDSSTKEFYTERTLQTFPNSIIVRDILDLNDLEYFCNKSWTVSYNVNTKSWISFHTYIPNFYIAENNFFYSGINGCCDDEASLDVISTVVLPPDTTTTTSSTSTSTTTTTTTLPPDCGFEANIVINSCALAGTANNISTTCSCYKLINTTANTISYSYTSCSLDVVITDTLSAYESVDVCAKVGSVVTNVGIDTFVNGDCSTDAECTTSTTTSTTTICPNCKTYTLENTATSIRTATSLVNCNTGLLYSLQINPGEIRHACSCNPPVVPEDVTSIEFGTGCTTCFCYIVTNIEGVENYFDYIDCNSIIITNVAVPAYSSISICAIEGTIGPLSPAISYTGGTVSCTSDLDCDCLGC